MRILFDENVLRKLRIHLIGHSISTVQEMGWSSLKNGELLRVANGKFDILLTVDKNLRYQNNFTGLDVAVITIVVKYNKLQNLIPLVSDLLKSVDDIRPGMIVALGDQ